MSVVTEHMPVNYRARWAGDFSRFLDTLDNWDVTHPRSSRPVSRALRQLSPGEAVIVEGVLWDLLVGLYRRGLLP